ncbi:cytochrome P450 [Clohesyomyces aquaticus]|uniref:Cytochrome P450 n=1 Tax=Clohesyomyces aquaticus TaxID=1231657 RepID=A0A1Y1YQK2_9PLEO|nr:cytochrome P450 [Clohesyomyces aquaticus]
MMELLPEATALTYFNAVALVIGFWLISVVLYGLYNITLHPLRSYPGPPLWRAYRFPWVRSTLAGRFPTDVLKLHNTYGPVVRVSPNELSYTDSRASKPIYGHHNPTAEGCSEFVKDLGEYQVPPNGVRSILSADTTTHGRYRRLLSHSFSEKGMREMQPRIQSYVEQLIQGLKDVAKTDSYIDISEWFTWATFDMIGDLAFGKPFNCLETREMDPWMLAVFGNVKSTMYVNAIRNYGLGFLLPWLTPKGLLELRQANTDRAFNKTKERLKYGTDRGDFWDNVIAKSDFDKGTGMTLGEMTSNAAVLVLGGSETTATLLSGTIYLLLMNPDKMEKLLGEVREAFNHDSEIDLISVGKLDYMLAVLDEAMRVYPPVPNQGNRLVPASGAMIAGKWVPGGTSVQVQQWASNHSSSNFAQPDAFIPERWLTNAPAEFATDDRAARTPFSLGPRNCIGRNLAYAEVRLILARVCFNFDLELDEKRCKDWIRDQKVYALWEKNPLWVRLSMRSAKT